VKRNLLAAALLACTALAGLYTAFAGKPPYGASAPNIPISRHDRIYTGDQFSNAVSVVDSSDNKTFGVISFTGHMIAATVKQTSSFCPNIAAVPDGKQAWITLKDTGRTQVFNPNPPFSTLKILDIGPISDQVNIVRNADGTFAYGTIGGLNEVKPLRTGGFPQVATIPVGALRHGLWPSGDGTRIYIGLENGDAVTANDTLTNKVIATRAMPQAPQATIYVPDAVPNLAGAAIVNAIGPAQQIVQNNEPTAKQYLVILAGTPAKFGVPAPVQVAS